MTRVSAATLDEVRRCLDDGITETKEIVRIIGKTKSTVNKAKREITGGRRAREGQIEPQPPAQRKPCRTCAHHVSLGCNYQFCQYILDTGRRRGCTAMECVELGLYEKSNNKQRKAGEISAEWRF